MSKRDIAERLVLIESLEDTGNEDDAERAAEIRAELYQATACQGRARR